MSTSEIVNDEKEQTKSSILNENLSMVEHQQIQKKCLRTVGNLLKGNSPSSVTTAATISSTKVACKSYNSLGKIERKSVVSSLCMSVERKASSLQYLSEARKCSPCVLSAGQNTIINLDNYAQFMAQRASTSRSGTLPREQEDTVSCSSATTGTSTSGGKDIAIGVVDVDLKVVLGGVSSYCTRQQTINMHKQKAHGKHFLNCLSFFVYNFLVYRWLFVRTDFDVTLAQCLTKVTGTNNVEYLKQFLTK